MHYNIADFEKDISYLAKTISPNYDFIYGVPRGGVQIAIALSNSMMIPLIDFSDYNYRNEELPDRILVVDDVIDSGATRMKYKNYDFACLHIKENSPILIQNNTVIANKNRINDWIHYWWEGEEKPAEDAIIRLIQAIGDDPNREGLKETPKRVMRSWKQLYCGYEGDPKEKVQNLFKQFSSDGYDEIVLLKDIEFYSFCEHHMLPFFGKAHVAYIPHKKIVGISKLARLLDIHSRKFQIQERIGELVTNDIMKYLDAQGAACIISAQHLCMRMRGVSKQHSTMITSSMKGVFLDKAAARAELMVLVK